MKSGLTLAVLLAFSLIPTMQYSAMAVVPEDTRQRTVISLDLPEVCENTMSCNAEVFTNTNVTFTGKLTDSNGTPLNNSTVNIVAFLPSPSFITVASTTTNNEGIFEVKWTVKLPSEIVAGGSSGRKFKTESMVIMAEFTGDSKYAPSRSNKLPIQVTVNTLRAVVNSDKNTYLPGDTATINIVILDDDNNFITPDNLFVTVNNERVKVDERTTGVYTLTLPALEQRHTQIVVVPEKADFRFLTAYLTIIVGGLR